MPVAAAARGGGRPRRRRPSRGAAAEGDALAARGAASSMLPAADSASGKAGQPEAAGGGAAGSHGPGGETGGRGAPAAAGEEGAAEDEEDDDPRASRFALAAGLGLLAASVALLGRELSGPGSGGWPGWALLPPLRLALYAGCAAAAASLGALLGLLWRGRRLPPPSFPAAADMSLPPVSASAPGRALPRAFGLGGGRSGALLRGEAVIVRGTCESRRSAAYGRAVKRGSASGAPVAGVFVPLLTRTDPFLRAPCSFP